MRWIPVGLALILGAPGAGSQMLAGCPSFPADNVWNARVDKLPVHPDSALWVATIGATAGAHMDFGSGLYQGAPIGIPWIDVPGTQPAVALTFDVDEESDPGPYPIPPDAPIEGGPASSGDRHLIVVDRDNCILYELFYAFPQMDGSWTAYSGAIFDLNSNALRPDTWTSADAAGLPILPGLARFEEVDSGEIRHALRFTAPDTRNGYVWPARHEASDNDGDQYPPLGARFRLRADYPEAGFSPHAEALLRAFKHYGLILADNGSAWFVTGAPDEGWDNDVLHELDVIQGSDWEAIDTSSLILDPDSGRVTSIFADGFESGGG